MHTHKNDTKYKALKLSEGRWNVIEKIIIFVFLNFDPILFQTCFTIKNLELIKQVPLKYHLK